MGLDVTALISPLPGPLPCGEDLEDSQVLGAFDPLRVFGQLRPLGSREKAGDRPLNWRDVRALSEQTLAVSKDFRTLAHLASAALRLDGVESFVQSLEVAAAWLDRYWDDVYPRVTDDAVARRSALACFADRMAMLDALRRAPLVSHKVLGTYALRDIELSQGRLQPGPDETRIPTPEEIDATFMEVASEDLQGLEDTSRRAVTAVAAIENLMNDRARRDGAPNLTSLSEFFQALIALVRRHVELRERAAAEAAAAAAELQAPRAGDAASVQPGTSSAGPAAAPPPGGQANHPVDREPALGGLLVPGCISSREDAIRCLDAIGDFFRRTEPSSPVPLFVDRTKRLITMDFLQLLGEIVPSAVPEARSAAGIKDQQGG